MYYYIQKKQVFQFIMNHQMSVNIMDDKYEDKIPLPSDLKVQWDPDQSGQLFIHHPIQELHSSGLHKPNQSVPQHQNQFESYNGTDTQASISSETQIISQINSPMEQGGEKQLSTIQQKRSKRRENDDNNAHKAFITILNKVLAEAGLLETMKKDLKKEGETFAKGSRYSIIMRLIDTKSLLIKKNEVDRLESILNYYSRQIQKIFQLPPNFTPADQLLYSLIEPYQKAVVSFLQGNPIEATQRIYDLQGLKQASYKKKGIMKVQKYLKKKELN